MVVFLTQYAYDIQEIPANFLLDQKGVMIGRYLRGEALPDKLKDIFLIVNARAELFKHCKNYFINALNSMKFIKSTFILLFLFPLFLFSQESFTINGKLSEEFNGSKLYFGIRDNNRVEYNKVDSVVVKNGAFHFNGKI